MHTLYTIGHSNQSFEELLQMLQTMGIQVLIDVRSVPASKYTPQFNREPLQAALNKAGIHYMWFGNEFGARRTDALDANNKVDFEKAVTDSGFPARNGACSERFAEGLSYLAHVFGGASAGMPSLCDGVALVL